MLCTEAVAVNRNDHTGEISLLHCNRWSCEICHPRNRRKVIAAGIRGQPNKLLTLTCVHGAYDTFDEAARDMKRGLDALKKRIARHFNGRKIPMMVVFEAHKSGWPHMHILMRTQFIAQSWLSEAWAEITNGAWSVDIRAIDPGGASRYVSKYIGKALHAFAGCKRWWRSHDYEVEHLEERVKVRYGQPIKIIEGVQWDSYVAAIQRDPYYEILEERPGWIKFSDWAPPNWFVRRQRGDPPHRL